jgi:hypothetical protein
MADMACVAVISFIVGPPENAPDPPVNRRLKRGHLGCFFCGTLGRLMKQQKWTSTTGKPARDGPHHR